MDFSTTFSAEYLRGQFVHMKMNKIQQVVEQIAGVALRSAQQGGLHTMVDFSSVDSYIRQSGIYKITIEDIVEGLRLKCPGCKVQYEELWEPSPRNPNQMDKKAGITIDWS